MRWHPDRNQGSEEASKKFKEVSHTVLEKIALLTPPRSPKLLRSSVTRTSALSMTKSVKKVSRPEAYPPKLERDPPAFLASLAPLPSPSPLVVLEDSLQPILSSYSSTHSRMTTISTHPYFFFTVKCWVVSLLSLVLARVVWVWVAWAEGAPCPTTLAVTPFLDPCLVPCPTKHLTHNAQHPHLHHNFLKSPVRSNCR